MGFSRLKAFLYITLALILVLSFQNCGPLKFDQSSLGGGEPYPGNQEVPVIFISNTIMCPDSQPSYAIVYFEGNFTQTRENCTDVTRSLSADSILWIVPNTQLEYNENIYDRTIID